MADPLVGHHPHAVLHRLLRRREDDVGAHDVPDRGLPRRAPPQDDLASVVTLRDDADDLVAILYDQRADLLLGHQPDGVQHHRFGPDAPDVLRLGLQQMVYGLHCSSPSTVTPAGSG